jgi:ferritin-like metal-binding protein YciE
MQPLSGQPTLSAKLGDREMSTLRDALVNEIKDLYHAEKQLVLALPKLSKRAASTELKDALDTHLEETERHVTRLEDVFEHLEEQIKAKNCPGMAGIIEEGSATLGEDFDVEVMDAAIIAAAQRAEHYEIAAYGTATAWAEALGLSDVADLLGQTLEEEKAADQKLTTLAEQGINAAAVSGDGEGDNEAENEEEEGDETGERASSGPGATSSRAGNGRTNSRRKVSPASRRK